MAFAIFPWESSDESLEELSLIGQCGKVPVTNCALEWFLSCMDPLMVLQVSWSWKSLATLCAIEWLLSIAIPFMNLYLMWKSSCHIWCTSLVVSFMDPLIISLSLLIMRSSCHTSCTWIASLQCHSFLESWCGKAPETSMFFPSWILWCYFLYFDPEKLLPHSVQLNGFSLV